MVNPFARHDDPHQLAVGMTGVKMGESLLLVGCAHGGRLGAVAAKVGLSGRALAVVPDDASAERARKGAANAGVLVDVVVAPASRLEAEDEGFDLAVVDDTAGVYANLTPEFRTAAIRDLLRALRRGGRAIVVGAAPRGGFGALLTRVQSGPPWDVVESLRAGGFTSVRTLADREGLVFTEGIKPR